MIKTGYIALVAAFGLFWALPVLATASQPIDISADQALEWDRQNNRYIARGNAAAIQGDTILKADELVAHYDADGAGATDITEIEAIDQVEILNGTMTLYGDAGRYDVTTGLARLTGDDLRMESEQAIVTARDYFEYDMAAQKITAQGQAVVLQGDHRLETSHLIAHLNQNAAGETAVETIEAPERVTIMTTEEQITGDRGTYDTVNEIAILTGNVTITQGENVLTGTRAEVDTKSGLSRLTAPEDQQGLPGRVRGVFYPETDEKEE